MSTRSSVSTVLGAVAVITSASADPRVYTNQDLAAARGNLSIGLPCVEAIPEEPVPPERRARVKRLADRYRKLRARLTEIEEHDLPAARAAEARDAFAALGRPRAATRRTKDPHAAVARLLASEEKLLREIRDVEEQARRLGLTSVGLLRSGER
ncbi:MAG: hypothetical protein U0166_22490 [Acidobacteriota bacterium]